MRLSIPASLFLKSATTAILIAVSAFSAPPSGSNWQMSFNDEFEGTSLDLQKWDTVSVCCGHRQFDAYNLGSNCIVQNGILREVIRNGSINGSKYLAAAITTRSFKQQFGYFEIRCKLPSGNGLWPAFWMDGKDPLHYEIDIFEQLGCHPTRVWYTMHKWTGGHNQCNVGAATSSTLTTAFHTMGMEWKAGNTCDFYLDDQKVASSGTNCFYNDNIPALPICANFQSDNLNWECPPIDNTTVLPAYYDIDWIRIYSKSTTRVEPRDYQRTMARAAIKGAPPVLYSLRGERIGTIPEGNVSRRSGSAAKTGVAVAMPAVPGSPYAAARMIVR